MSESRRLNQNLGPLNHLFLILDFFLQQHKTINLNYHFLFIDQDKRNMSKEESNAQQSANAEEDDEPDEW
jgi:hypothetical protein